MHPTKRSPLPLHAVRSARRCGGALALVLAAAGCADLGLQHLPREHPMFGSAGVAVREQRESQMNRLWQHRQLQDLVTTLGEPRLMMRIPGGGITPGFAVVYGRDPETGCIDAFAISTRLGRNALVRHYYCR